MEFSLDPQAEALRLRVREFLRENHPGRPPKDAGERRQWQKAWLTLLAKRGFTGPAWPKEWGGMGLSLAEQIAYHEEVARARVPGGPSGLGIIGPTLLRFGTRQQQERYLPPMVAGENDWCLGYSEPGSGSDLASLSTRASRDGEELIVNGQKVWTSNSMTADLMAALVRPGLRRRVRTGSRI